MARAASAIAFAFAAALYMATDLKTLRGSWILDDKGTVTMNPVVMGSEPWSEVWARDYWGHDQLVAPESHKSWRPITTASYRLTYAVVAADPLWYHVTDRLLHAVVTALSVPVARLCLDGSDAGAFYVALLFAAHPIHVESVSNTTGRAEVLCAMFFMIGFLAFAAAARGAPTPRTCHDRVQAPAEFLYGKLLWSPPLILCMLVMTWCSMLCKEHGITLPIAALVWDSYLGTSTNVPELWGAMLGAKSAAEHGDQPAVNTTDDATDGTAGPPTDDRAANHAAARQQLRRAECQAFLIRVAVVLLGTLSIASWRLSRNGTAAPDFACEQNPTACADDRVVRFLTYSWLWAFNFILLCWPAWLSPDWSGPSIPLVQTVDDHRLLAVVALILALAATVAHGLSAACTPSPRLAVLSAVPPPADSGAAKVACSRFEAAGGADDVVQLPVEDVAGGDGESPQELMLFPEAMVVPTERRRRIALVAVAWMLITFIMSSNLFFYVGFVVADRVLYLPSFGFLLLLVQTMAVLADGLSQRVVTGALLASAEETKASQRRLKTRLLQAVFGVVLAAYCHKQRVQNWRWADPVEIWGEGYRVNPDSCINGGELGMSLSNAGRPRDAVPVLWRNHRRELAGDWYTKHISDEPNEMISKWQRMSSLMNTRFKLTTAMANCGMCDKALPLVEEALSLIELQFTQMNQLAADNGHDAHMMEIIRKGHSALGDSTAYFFITKSRCQMDLPSMIHWAERAIAQRPGMRYAQDYKRSVDGIVQSARASGVDPSLITITFKQPTEGQQVERIFGIRHPGALGDAGSGILSAQHHRHHHQQQQQQQQQQQPPSTPPPIPSLGGVNQPQRQPSPVTPPAMLEQQRDTPRPLGRYAAV